ncbi:MAG: DUF1028 domain-containing protein, partial [Planctomycetota bacterium]|nr:DUF1028 domain-containing protein [Planctomycetota bacterium]
MRTSHSNGVLLVFVTLSTNLTIASTTPAQTPEEPIMKRPVSTYSIVARDPTTGEMGVAVQSHWFSVG